ncbi:unnamed protein product [Medioppia subpectinata]|uniref:glutamine synthetase n=1 Tax=Medioppia subpectinata TaxID=1979941 RepID=A0A7R9KDA6_9ACAR|nr:unnamed protein product [Medioppia subpectinata]CAG2101389.1 unnamed protein product [Medioppia subpectinata]
MTTTPTPLASNSAFMARYMALEQPADKIQVTYIYLHPGSDNLAHYCGKTKVVDFVPKHPDELPLWDTGIMQSSETEILLRPVRLYNDPFRGGNNRLALCNILDTDMKPFPCNHRYSCLEAMEAVAKQHPWFGVEQEYMLMDGNDRKRPLGWPVNGYPEPLTTPHIFYHSGVGANNQYGRDVMEAHFRACLYAGVNITGENAEGQPSQWEYQVGTCEGIQLGDDLIMSRYILLRVAEDLHIGVTFDPKPVPTWMGNGAHMNFSTEAMRREGGLAEINRAIKALRQNHDKHMALYDPRGRADNQRRLTGQMWASDINKFTSAVGDRAVSVRIPKRVEMAGKGYLEDRRPASNCDPYTVTEALVRTVCLNE